MLAFFLRFVVEQFPLALVVKGNPAGPIEPVKEPVHDDEQNENGKQSGCSLNGQRGDILSNVVEDANNNAPR